LVHTTLLHQKGADEGDAYVNFCSRCCRILTNVKSPAIMMYLSVFRKSTLRMWYLLRRSLHSSGSSSMMLVGSNFWVDGWTVTATATARQRQTAREGVSHTYMSACHGKSITDSFQQRFRLRQRKRGNECVCVCELKLKVWQTSWSTSFNDGDEGISDSTPFQLSQVRGLTRWWRRAPNIAVNDPWL
ncbi:hypothetical protein CABS01_15375, partial [Colletotrichum abscissum]|uniref:uncharacterized protein n=1 Tax=Colletotrichum abscissum TaxID=1671311 RepID=UPI0027D6E45B